MSVNDKYIANISTKYIISLFFIVNILLLLASFLFGTCYYYSFIDLLNNQIKLSTFIIWNCFIIMLIFSYYKLYMFFRYHLGKVQISKEGIQVNAFLAKKLYIIWEDIITYGTIRKYQSIIFPSVIWLYFSKVNVTMKEAMAKAPNIDNKTIFISIKKDKIDELKYFIPDNIYKKILEDL